MSSRRRLSVPRVLGGSVLLIVVAIGVVFFFQVRSAVGSLNDAGDQAELLKQQVIDGDVAGAQSTLASLRDATGDAASTSGGVLWDAAAKVPFVGDDVDTVRDVSQILDRVTADALPPIVDVADRVNLNAFSPRDGRVDLTAVKEIAPALSAAKASLTSARAELDSVGTDGLVGGLGGSVAALKSGIDSAVTAAEAGDTAARLLPSMLGDGGTRRYLLLVQNNAEVRATGGIPGSFALITAKNGKLTMGAQGGIRDLLPFDQDVVPMTKDEKTVFTDQFVRDLRNITQTPDFTRSAEIGRAMVAKGLGQDVDGVLSVDPVAMSYILGGTGPVTLPLDVQLGQTNAVELLLNTVYLRLPDEDQQDEAFQSAARAVFDAVSAGAGESRRTIAGLVRAANENRLMVWSSHDDEQEVIGTTGIAGTFPADGGASPNVGVYFGDATGSKLQYYFDFTPVATASRCLEGGRQEITVRTTLSSSVPDGLPIAVTGYSEPVGVMKLFGWMYAPFGGRFTDIRLGDEKVPITTATLDGRAETSVPITLTPGQTTTLVATMVTGPGQRGDGVLSTTPGIRTIDNDSVIRSAC